MVAESVEVDIDRSYIDVCCSLLEVQYVTLTYIT